MASRGHRVIGCAQALLPRDKYPVDYVFSKNEVNYPTSDYCFTGLVSLEDPPKHGVREAIGTLRLAGIKVMMVTGLYIYYISEHHFSSPLARRRSSEDSRGDCTQNQLDSRRYEGDAKREDWTSDRTNLRWWSWNCCSTRRWHRQAGRVAMGLEWVTRCSWVWPVIDAWCSLQQTRDRVCADLAATQVRDRCVMTRNRSQWGNESSRFHAIAVKRAQALGHIVGVCVLRFSES